jgi:hypothetical protein
VFDHFLVGTPGAMSTDVRTRDAQPQQLMRLRSREVRRRQARESVIDFVRARRHGASIPQLTVEPSACLKILVSESLP